MTRKPPPITGLGQSAAGDWRDHAACRQLDMPLVVVDAIFFPTGASSDRSAKAICRSCPVALECLEDALDGGKTLQGVFGGLSERERRNVIRQRQRIRADDRADRAAALYRTLRPGAQSDYAAHLAIATALGVHHRTVAKWTAGIEWGAAQGSAVPVMVPESPETR